MPGKLLEPIVITYFNNKPVAMLPSGFYFDDSRWETIWEEYDLKGELLTMEDLRRLFPDNSSLHIKKLNRVNVQTAAEFKKDNLKT